MKILLTLIIIAVLLSGCGIYQNYRILRSDANISESLAEITKMRADCLKRKQSLATASSCPVS